MTSDRANAYGRVIATIEQLGATKLQPGEIDRLRAAIDTLLFSEDVSDPATRDALEDTRALCEHLAESGRWTADRAAALARDVDETGPLAGGVRRG